MEEKLNNLVTHFDLLVTQFENMETLLIEYKKALVGLYEHNLKIIKSCKKEKVV